MLITTSRKRIDCHVDLLQGLFCFGEICLSNLSHIGELGQLIYVVSDAPHLGKKRLQILDQSDLFSESARDQILGTAKFCFRRLAVNFL